MAKPGPLRLLPISFLLLVGLCNPIRGQQTDSNCTILTGTVSLRSFRPIRPAADPHTARLLRDYEVDPAAFPWQMKLITKDPNYTLWEVTFPSPYISPDPQNNTVWCEYFQSNHPAPRPAVIVLHILQNDFALSRIICHSLASAGLDTMLVKMAYYGPRRPTDPSRHKELVSDLSTLVLAVRQTVMDIRRAVRFLAERQDVDPDRIGICGVSLGALVAATAIGVDTDFPKAALVLGGSDLATIISSGSKEVRQISEYIQAQGITDQQLRQILMPIEPLAFSTRTESTNVLMLNARNDKIIPAACAEQLSRALPHSELIWYDADHYSMIWYLPEALAKIRDFFAEPTPPSKP